MTVKSKQTSRSTVYDLDVQEPLRYLQLFALLVLSRQHKDRMGDLDDYDFSTGDAGASNVYNMEAGQIRVGG